MLRKLAVCAFASALMYSGLEAKVDNVKPSYKVNDAKASDENISVSDGLKRYNDDLLKAATDSLDSGNIEACKNLTERITEDSPDLYALKGCMYAYSDEPHNAIKFLKLYLSTNPDLDRELEMNLMLGRLYLSVGVQDTAYKIFDNVIYTINSNLNHMSLLLIAVSYCNILGSYYENNDFSKVKSIFNSYKLIANSVKLTDASEVDELNETYKKMNEIIKFTNEGVTNNFYNNK